MFVSTIRVLNISVTVHTVFMGRILPANTKKSEEMIYSPSHFSPKRKRAEAFPEICQPRIEAKAKNSTERAMKISAPFCVNTEERASEITCDPERLLSGGLSPVYRTVIAARAVTDSITKVSINTPARPRVP